MPLELLPLLRSVLPTRLLALLLSVPLALHPPAVAEMLHQRSAEFEQVALAVSLAPQMMRWLPPPPPLGPPGNEEQWLQVEAWS